MKKVFFAIASLSVLTIALSFAYYLVIFLPEKEKAEVLREQKIELVPSLTLSPTPTLILTSTPAPVSNPIPALTSAPVQLPNSKQESEITPNQQAVLDGINRAIEENKTKMAEQKEILDREAKDYCPDLNLQYSDYRACETERFAKHKRAEEEYLRLQELNKELALEALKILGQK